MEEAKKILMMADARSKAIIAELQHAGLEKVEDDRNVVSNAYQIAMLLRLMDDEQFLEAEKKFRLVLPEGREQSGREKRTHKLCGIKITRKR